MRIQILTAAGFKYQGPHVFNDADKAIDYLRRRLNDNEIEWHTDPNEEGAASAEIYTMLCGNPRRVATALID